MFPLFSPRVEQRLGRAQYKALTSVVRRIARVTAASAEVDGVDVPYFFRASTSGKPPFVLVHGFGGDKESWLVMASFLPRSRGLIIPDLPGFGAAGSIPKELASAKAQAKALAALLDRLGVDRAHVVGNSMGGGIALRFAADYPARAASITLVGSVGPHVEKSEVGLALDRGENPLLTTSADDLGRLMKLVAERPPPVTRAIQKHLGAERFARRDSLATLFDGWNAPSDGHGIPTELATITTPALVLHGAKDRVIHVATGKALADGLANATLEIYDGVGHVPQIELPKKTADSVEKFASRVE